MLAAGSSGNIPIASISVLAMIQTYKGQGLGVHAPGYDYHEMCSVFLRSAYNYNAPELAYVTCFPSCAVLPWSAAMNTSTRGHFRIGEDSGIWSTHAVHAARRCRIMSKLLPTKRMSHAEKSRCCAREEFWNTQQHGEDATYERLWVAHCGTRNPGLLALSPATDRHWFAGDIPFDERYVVIAARPLSYNNGDIAYIYIEEYIASLMNYLFLYMCKWRDPEVTSPWTFERKAHPHIPPCACVRAACGVDVGVWV